MQQANECLFDNRVDLEEFLLNASHLIVNSMRYSHKFNSFICEHRQPSLSFWSEIFQSCGSVWARVAEANTQQKEILCYLAMIKTSGQLRIDLPRSFMRMADEEYLHKIIPIGRNSIIVNKIKQREDTFPLTKRIKMNLTLNKPVMVGQVDILTASDETLAMIVREAQAQIKANEDLAEISANYQKKAKEIQTVIDLCVKQLDKPKK